MKRYYLGAMMLILIFGLACQSKVKTPPPVSPPGAGQFNLQKVTVMNRIIPENVRRDPFTLKKVKIISQHILVLDVSYSGGCQRHEFDLYLTTYLDQDKPDRVNTFLSHNSHNDPCDGWQAQTLYFDLTPLAEAYRSQTQRASGKLALSFPDAHHETQEIIYQF